VNTGLVRVHRVIFIAYAGFAVTMALLAIPMVFRGNPDASIGLVGALLLPIAGIHWYAAKGARLGQRSGRRVSIVIACLMLVGFPVGTFIALYIFSQVGNKWQDCESVNDAVAA
jgi:hypothetical protein